MKWTSFGKCMWAFVIVIVSLPMIAYSIRFMLYGYDSRDNTTGGITILSYIIVGIGLAVKYILEEV